MRASIRSPPCLPKETRISVPGSYWLHQEFLQRLILRGGESFPSAELGNGPGERSLRLGQLREPHGTRPAHPRPTHPKDTRPPPALQVLTAHGPRHPSCSWQTGRWCPWLGRLDPRPNDVWRPLCRAGCKHSRPRPSRLHVAMPDCGSAAAPGVRRTADPRLHVTKTSSKPHPSTLTTPT